MIYLSIIAIIAADGCDDDILLIPESMTGDVYSASYPLSRLLDGNYGSYWYGNSASEYVYYYFPSEVVVKEVFVQRYGLYAQYMCIYGPHTTYCSYFETNTEYYSIITFPMNNVQTNYLKFNIVYSGFPRLSRLEVYGCYNTSTPTTVPTSVPTELPTLFPTISPTLPPVTTDPTKTPSTLPTISPTLPPVTTDPTKTPSTLPTTAPTKSPSTLPTTAPTKSPSGDSPSPQPSTAPSSSPTESPTVVYIDHGLQITLGEIELLVIVFLCVLVFLCGVIFIVVRRYRVVQAVQNSHKAQESEMYIVRTQDIEEESTRIATKNLFNRKVDMSKTVYNEGENKNTEYGKVSNDKLGEEKNERTESHVVSDQREDLFFALDQVKSEL